MALSDLEAFLRERLAIFDDTLDVSSGSPVDVVVIQPVLRRFGTDPFTVDLFTFAQERLTQDFPDLATKEGDAVTDLLIKPALVLWDPIVREIARVRQSLSFRDPTTLTLDEAEALGANLFSERETGDKSRGTVRMYFAQPQNINVNPANFFTSKSGLHFFPTNVQSISVSEMLLNVEGSLYYFDVSVVAEKAGDQYNIGADEIVTVANIVSAVRVTNKRRFRFGTPEEDVVTFIDRTKQELTERSLVTLRGIDSRLTASFPELTRLAVVGFNDPEMQRDKLEGGGLGPIRASGFQMQVVSDGESQARSRRLTVADSNIDFIALIGVLGDVPSGWSLTVVDAFGSDPERIRDLTVRKVLSSTSLDLEDQVLYQSFPPDDVAWMLRKSELTLSGIPGGILFPDGPNGTVSVEDGSVHIGGATDALVRGSDFESSSLVIDVLTDDAPILSGTHLQVLGSNYVELNEWIEGTNYTLDDSTSLVFQNAKTFGYTLQIIDGPAAGSYRIIDVVEAASAAVQFLLDPLPALVLSTDFRWRLLDEIDVDLVSPRETRVTGSDMSTIQGSNVVTTTSGIDFDAAGVAAGDVVRIEDGPDAGDYKVVSILTPFNDRLELGTVLTSTHSSLEYSVFRANTAGGILRPLIRVSSIDILDTSGQPIGSTIPYSKAIDIRSTVFSNVAHGVKADVFDATLGIVSQALPAGANVNGLTLIFTYTGGPTTVTFSGSNPFSAATIVTQINTAFGKVVAFTIDGDRVGVVPLGGLTTVTGGTARSALFGTTEVRSSRDIRSQDIEDNGGWAALSPSLELDTDVAQVLDGSQIGFYSHPVLGSVTYAGPPASTALLSDQDFSPEVNRHVQVGARSIGTTRMYFLDPTSVEVDGGTDFVAVDQDGVTLHYFPDPTVRAQKIPPMPSGTTPNDGETASLGVFTSASVDFVKKSIREGDILSILYEPVTGTVNLTDPVVGLAFTSIILSIDGGPDKTITFVRDSTTIPSNAVTRAGIATQINRAVGKTICSIVTVGAVNNLEFEADAAIVLRKTGSANSLLGFSTSSDTNNTAESHGDYTITDVTAGSLTVTPAFTYLETRLMYKIYRPGAQRVSSTEMASNKTDAGLYYFDVELFSEGTGDLWNIPSSTKLTATSYRSDGYYLTTDDPNLTFSVTEPVTLHVSRSILDIGVSDDPENATQLSGQNIQINYDKSSLVESVQNFMSAETERVVNESPLARHLIPHFVRFELSYIGGSKESEVTPGIESYIKDLFPEDALEVSDLEKIISNKGATSITNPVDLVAIVHNFDRSISVERSQNRLTTGRLAAFIPDQLTIKRRTT